MDLIITRMYSGPDGILSVISDEHAEEVCYGLEHSYMKGSGWEPKIPSGVYTCKRRLSPHFGYELFQVLEVPNAIFIEIHKGNLENDSRGCILLGIDHQSTAMGTMVTHSGDAFKKFMELQNGMDYFKLTVRG